MAELCRLHDSELRDLTLSLDLIDRSGHLGQRDAIFAATALNRGIEVVLTSDQAFDEVRGLERIDPLDTARVEELAVG